MNLISGQVTLTGSAQQLTTTSQVVRGVTLHAKSTNGANAFFGGATVTTGTGRILEPGYPLDVDIIDPTLVYVIGTANDVISWSGLVV